MNQTGRPALHYDGRIGELYRLFLTNLLFTILSLGLYRFWAVTRNRRYVWSRLAFQGQRFEYTGRGSELFLGFLLAGLAIFGVLLVVGLLVWILPYALKAVVVLLLYAAFFVVAAGAVFAAQRYRLTRTQWCGVRGGMEGSMLAYGLRAVGYYLLAGVTLLQMVPWVQVRLAERRINASRFGATPFRFEGRAGLLYPIFLATTVGFVVVGALYGWAVSGLVGGLAGPSTDSAPGDAAAAMAAVLPLLFGAGLLFAIAAVLVGVYYQVCLTRHILGRTTIGPVRFSSAITTGGFLWLIVSNVLILVVTLGLGFPVIVHRSLLFLQRTLHADGVLEPARLGPAAGPVPQFGEGLYQQLG